MDNIIVWGAFGVDEQDVGANSGGKLINYLDDHKDEYKIRFWVDNAERKWGKDLYGHKVYSPEIILDYPNDVILINSLSFCDIRNQISLMGG